MPALSPRRLTVAVAGALAITVGQHAPAHAEPDCNVPDPPPICGGGGDPDPVPDPGGPPVGHLDVVTSSSGGLRVQGWAIDPDTTEPIDVRILVDGKPRQTVRAATSRPDVAAAYPGYGAMHGFDAVLDGERRHSSVCAVALNVQGGAGATSLGCRRERGSLSILNLNARGSHNFRGWAPPFDRAPYPDQEQWLPGSRMLPWHDRWDRIADWMRASGTLPDIITLQEAPARKIWSFPPGPDDPKNYEALVRLSRRIERLTHANYRIAYQSAYPVHNGLNLLMQGRAMLYNADRVRNVTSRIDPSAPFADADLMEPHKRRSHWCDPERDDGCGRLDDDGFWTIGFKNPIGGAWTPGADAAMFELLDEPGREILVHNVHVGRAYDHDTKYDQALRKLVDATVAMTANRTHLYPPLIAGDFNGDPRNQSDFMRLSRNTIDFVLAGKPSVHDSVYRPVSESEILPVAREKVEHDCGTYEVLWSDHCANFVQLFPEPQASTTTRWDLAEDFGAANPGPDRRENAAVWSFSEGPRVTDDASHAYRLDRHSIDRIAGLYGLECWEPETDDPDPLPIVCKNTRYDNPWPYGINWEPNAMLLHPSPGRSATVAWRSTINGTVEIRGAVRDLHPGCGDGIRWKVAATETLATGEIADGGHGSFSGGALERLDVRPGTMIVLTVDSGSAGDHGCDSTGVDLTITGRHREDPPTPKGT